VPASLEAGVVSKAAGGKGGGWLVSSNWEGMEGTEYWSAGVLVYWNDGVLVDWSNGVVVSWARAAAGRRTAAKRHKEHKRTEPGRDVNAFGLRRQGRRRTACRDRRIMLRVE
jgi:hypothetical protein